jgi:hypothetical protein
LRRSSRLRLPKQDRHAWLAHLGRGEPDGAAIPARRWLLPRVRTRARSLKAERGVPALPISAPNSAHKRQFASAGLGNGPSDETPEPHPTESRAPTCVGPLSPRATMTDTPRKPIWTRKRCAEEYLRRTGRPPLDDARLGWALAVRAHIHEQALRGFANVGRARPVGVSADWPDWVTVGVGALRPAFDAYCAVDFGWVLLLEWPKIALDLGVLGDGLRADVAKRAEGIEAVERARRELDVSRGARARRTRRSGRSSAGSRCVVPT